MCDALVKISLVFDLQIYRKKRLIEKQNSLCVFVTKTYKKRDSANSGTGKFQYGISVKKETVLKE